MLLRGSKQGRGVELSRKVLEEAVVASRTVTTRADDRLQAVLAEHGLTHATAQALWAIDPDGEPPSMKTMAQRLFCNSPNLTFVVGQLTERGLVVREVDPADRRSRRVTLTEEGLRVRSAITDAALETSPLRGLTATEQRQLVKLLRKALDSTP